MCGITGAATLGGYRIDENIIMRMTNLLGHRGPDDNGLYLSHQQNPNSRLKVGLGHRRLSIIDIEGGHQPMATGDKRIWIVYNGEIYNFPELREALIRKGHKFATRSDTEVIMHLYQEKGVDCLGDLRGMFAFCIWDAEKERLFLARDRAGQKPLFYYAKNGLFIFGSEIKAILGYDSVERQVDLTSLDGYLTYGYVPPPPTIFKGIKKLLPAHYLIYDGRDLKSKRYWSLSYRDKTRLNFHDCRDRLYELLGEATKMRLISDVPLGAFLSGGVDSSCIVALMSRLSQCKVKTFSIGFKEEEFDELKYASLIAKRLGTEHKEFIVEPKELEILSKLAWHYDQPFGDSSCIPTYYVSKMTREFVTVALNGDGGDESFAGYRRYRGIRLAYLLKDMPKPLLSAGYRISPSEYGRRFFAGLANNSDIEGVYLDWLNYFTDADKKVLYSKDIRLSLGQNGRRGLTAHSYLKNIITHSDAAETTERIMNADIMSYLPEDLLVKADIAAMAASLEGRSPFLDHKVMEFAATMPLEYKLKGSNHKYILKEAFKKEIPPPFLNRKKKGFSVPVGAWFRNGLKGFINSMLLTGGLADRGFFSKDYLEGLLNEHQKGARDHTNRIWALLSFEMWHRIFIDRKPLCPPRSLIRKHRPRGSM